MFNYFGGVPLMCVCDNCKTAIISHKKYEDIIFNKAYYEMAEYNGTAIMPARVKAPRGLSLKKDYLQNREDNLLFRMFFVLFLKIMFFLML